MKNRILNDQRIFQSTVNDLKLRHEEVTIADGTKQWAYVYDGVDPYELEDESFPTIMKEVKLAITSLLVSELKWHKKMANRRYTSSSIQHAGAPATIRLIDERIEDITKEES